MNLRSLGPSAVLAITLAACSDPVPLPAQGAFSMNIRAPAGPNAGLCKVQPHNANIGTPPLSATNSDVDRAVDKQGKPSADVSCTVKGKETFEVQGSLKVGSTSFFVRLVEPLPKQGSARAFISEFDATSQTSLASPTGNECTVTAMPAPLEIASGRIWATFDCPLIRDDRSVSTTSCSGSGVFLFENCEQ